MLVRVSDKCALSAVEGPIAQQKGHIRFVWNIIFINKLIVHICVNISTETKIIIKQ